ncbi:unnamed protein product [Camellia sinensis]
MEISHKNSLLFLVLVAFSAKLVLFCSADPTDGFTLVPLAEKNFGLQNHTTTTCPSTTAVEPGLHRSSGHDYSSGVWQLEGYFYVPKGTSGVTMMQIHGAKKGATTLQLRIYDGDMRYYRFEVVDTNLYDK